MEIENSRGPMIDPCGTPQDRGRGNKGSFLKQKWQTFVSAGEVRGIQYNYQVHEHTSSVI